MIPKIIHQIWVGNIPPTQQEKNTIHNFKEDITKEGFEYILWDNNNYPHLPINLIDYKNLCRECTTDKNNLGAFEADMLRYYVLYMYGGFYFDADIILRNSFLKLYNDIYTKDLIFSRWMKRPLWPSNAFLGAIKNHKFYEYTINSINYTRKTPPHIGPAWLGKRISEYFDINFHTILNGHINTKNTNILLMDWDRDVAYHRNNKFGIIQHLAYYSWRIKRK